MEFLIINYQYLARFKQDISVLLMKQWTTVESDPWVPWKHNEGFKKSRIELAVVLTFNKYVANCMSYTSVQLGPV